MVKNNFSTLFIRNPYVLWLSILVIIVAGLGSWLVLPRAEDPRILNRFAVVVTSFSGASADKVEALVTDPIEQKLRLVPEIKHVMSKSTPGLSYINIELKDEVMDVNSVWSRMRDYVAQTRLPLGASDAILDETRTYSFTKIIALEVKNQSSDNLLLAGRFAKELAARLRVVKDTDKVELFGEPKERVYVEVDPQALANLSLSMATLAQKIKTFDAQVAAGTLISSQHRMMVEVHGGFDNLKRLRELPILSHQGAIVYLQDIAQVRYTLSKSQSSILQVDNTRSIAIAIRMQDKKIIDQWDKKIDKVVAAFQSELPQSIQLKTLFNQFNYTKLRFSQLQNNMLVGLLSIIVVLFFTLGWRGSLIVGLTLPLTMLLTLFGIRLIGLSLNQMTVIGLIVALGIMIDNAIVIAEGIQQRRLQGIKALEAVARTVSHFWLPLLGATLTTVLAFLPIILLPGAMGEFVGGIGYSVIITLFGSYAIAHTIIASLAGTFLLGDRQNSWLTTGIQFPVLAKGFQRVLAWCLQHARLAALLLLIIALSGFIARLGLTEQFFPVSGRDQIKIKVYASASNDIIRTKKTVERMNRVIAKHPQVKNQVWSIGRGIPPFYYNILQKEEKNPSYAQAMVTLNHVNKLDDLVNLLQSQLDKQFPQMLSIVQRIDQGPPFDAPIEIRVYGQDLAQLQYLGDEIRKRLAKINSVTYTTSSLKTSLPSLTIELDEKQVHSLGLSSQKLARQIKHFIDGVSAGDLLEGTELIPIKVRLAAKDRAKMSQLLELPLSLVVVNQRYTGVTLSAVAQFKLLPKWRAISRRDSRRVNTIHGYLNAGVLPAEGLKQWQSIVLKEPIKLPPGYIMEIGGEKEKRDESVGNLLVNLPLIFLVLFAVLLLTFRSLRCVIILLLVVMLALSMGLLSLYISGYPFGFQVIIGLIGLIGLAINAAIVILSEIRRNVAAASGDELAINKQVGLCMRHITSTTLTTIAGFMPLILSGGKFWPPFAYVLAGGTLLTTLISVFWVPVLYKAFSKRPVEFSVEK